MTRFSSRIRRSAYFGPGAYDIGPSINLRSPTNVRIQGAGSNVEGQHHLS
jgi:hypothetical protein